MSEFRGVQQFVRWFTANESGIREWMTALGTVAAACVAAAAARSSRRSAEAAERAARLSAEATVGEASASAQGDLSEAYGIASRLICEIPIAIGEWRGISRGGVSSGLEEQIRHLEAIATEAQNAREETSRLLTKISNGGHAVADLFAYRTVAGKWLKIAQQLEVRFHADKAAK